MRSLVLSGCALVPPAQPSRPLSPIRSPGIWAGSSKQAGLTSWFSQVWRAPLWPFGTLFSNPPHLKGPFGRWISVLLGPAYSPGRNRWRESSSSSNHSRRRRRSRTSGTVEDKAPRLCFAEHHRPRLLLNLLNLLLITNPPARPCPWRGNREGERRAAGKGGNLHSAVSPHSQMILVAAFPENGRGSRHQSAAPRPAAVCTVSREATSRHLKEGGSHDLKKAQGRHNVRSTRRWNHGRIAISSKTSLLATVFFDPRTK